MLYFNTSGYLQCLVKIHVLVQGFIAVKRHHGHTKSYKEGILLGLLRVSEVQSIVIIMGSMWYVVLEMYLAEKKKLTVCHIEGSLNKGDLIAHPHSDTLPSTRSHLLKVPLPLGAIFFQTTTIQYVNSQSSNLYETVMSMLQSM